MKVNVYFSELKQTTTTQRRAYLLIDFWSKYCTQTILYLRCIRGEVKSEEAAQPVARWHLFNSRSEVSTDGTCTYVVEI